MNYSHCALNWSTSQAASFIDCWMKGVWSWGTMLPWRMKVKEGAGLLDQFSVWWLQRDAKLIHVSEEHSDTNEQSKTELITFKDLNITVLPLKESWRQHFNPLSFRLREKFHYFRYGFNKHLQLLRVFTSGETKTFVDLPVRTISSPLGDRTPAHRSEGGRGKHYQLIT